MNFLSFIILLLPFVATIDIHCEFKTDSWSVVDEIYECDIESDPFITSSNTLITAVNGNHLMSMSNEKVQGFLSSSEFQTIHYMPHGLLTIFPNLILIYIKNGKIKEIHQRDLEQYPKLKFLSLYQNDIKYLEKDLFKYNTQLQYIEFSYNKINRIHPRIFDNLNQLEFLLLDKNQCIDIGKKDKRGVIEVLREVKENCLPSSFSYYNQLEDLSKNFETVNKQLEEKSAKISNLEEQVNNLIKLIKEKKGNFWNFNFDKK